MELGSSPILIYTSRLHTQGYRSPEVCGLLLVFVSSAMLDENYSGNIPSECQLNQASAFIFAIIKLCMFSGKPYHTWGQVTVMLLWTFECHWCPVNTQRTSFYGCNYIEIITMFRESSPPHNGWYDILVTLLTSETPTCYHPHTKLFTGHVLLPLCEIKMNFSPRNASEKFLLNTMAQACHR